MLQEMGPMASMQPVQPQHSPAAHPRAELSATGPPPCHDRRAPARLAGSLYLPAARTQRGQLPSGITLTVRSQTGFLASGKENSCSRLKLRRVRWIMNLQTATRKRTK